MTDKPRVPADDARAGGLIVVAPVTHTFDPGYRAPIAGRAEASWRLDKPDPVRCSHCGMPLSHRHHGGTE